MTLKEWKNITLKERKKEQLEEIEFFVKWWIEQNRRNSSAFSLYNSHEDWDEEFEYVIRYYGEKKEGN